MAVETYTYEDLKNGLALKAAGLIAADTAETGVFIGRGWQIIEIVWTACEIATGDEFYNVQFQFNTLAATTTWVDGPNVAFGNAALLGGAAATAATGRMLLAIFNRKDYQVRVNTWVTGTIATGFNYAVNAFPMNQGAL